MKTPLFLLFLVPLYLGACSHSPQLAPIFTNTDKVSQLGPYTHVVQAGELVFVSGMIAHNPQTGFAKAEISTQTHQVFANLTAALAAVDLNLNDVVKTTIFLKNPDDFAEMNEIYATYFEASPPARTTVPGVDWGRPDILIEIEAIAAR